VTNITAFGAFVDIGVHQDGLVHLSQIADRYVKDPGDVLKVRQVVEVTVIAVDLERKRISLSMKKNPEIGESAAHLKAKSRTEKEGAPAEEKRGSGSPKPAPGKTRPGKAESHGGTGRKPGREKPPQEQTAPEGSPQGKPVDKQIRERQEQGKPKDARQQRIKPRNEKVPFNNPFVAVFGKK
jgi:predicted RNA-binding protein with RPS1 domain